MNGFVGRLLARIGFNQPTRDDVINAQIEDKAREHANLVGLLHTALARRNQSNGALRESIRIAKERTNSFADFEKLTIRREELHRD